MILLTPERLRRLGLARELPPVAIEFRSFTMDDASGSITELLVPEALAGLSRPMPASFQGAGDAIVLLGGASPGRRPPVIAAALNRLLLELAERQFLHSACRADARTIQETVSRAAEAGGFGVRWTLGWLMDVQMSLLAEGPLAVVTCRPRAHMALLRCADRSALLAAAMLGHVTCTK